MSPATTRQDIQTNTLLDDITIKIVDTLLENPTIPYTKTQLADAAGISRDALYRRWNDLQAYDIIQRAEDETGGDYWTLNQEADAVKALATLLHRQ
jgi:response regulator of citrate/malate metabolism